MRRQGIVLAVTAAAVVGLALPGYAQVPTPMKHGKPVTAEHCKMAGGTVEKGKCKGGADDGDTVSG